MKAIRFFLLLFLIPSLIYADFYTPDCAKINDKISSEWKQHNQLIEQHNNLGPNDREKGIALLKDSIACCQRAIDHCNVILKKIAAKSKSDRHQPEWVQQKKGREEDKNNLNAEIGKLKNAIDNKYREIAFEKAMNLYQESEKRGDLARAKEQKCSDRSNDVAKVVATLSETAALYDAALSKAHEALAAFVPFTAASDEQRKALLRQNIEIYQNKASKYKNEATERPAALLAQKSVLKEQYTLLKEERKLLEEKGFKRSSFDVQKQMASILQELIESGETDAFLEELGDLKNNISLSEKETSISSSKEEVKPEELAAREKLRRELFYKSDLRLNPGIFLQGILQKESRPFAIPLDGQSGRERKDFTLYTEQFYRFLVQSDTPVSHFFVKVYEKGEMVHQEQVFLPLKKTPAWERYLTKDGMIYIPETNLKTKFGLDLYLTLVPDPTCNFSLVISQKGAYSKYQFSISLDEEHPLYVCQFAEPPPWQLGMLSKPALPSHERSLGKSPFIVSPFEKGYSGKPNSKASIQIPILDKFIEELKGDPLLLAQYVYHEIALVDPFLHQENGVFFAPGIHRSILTTFLEKQGSPWEQCQLLVYLLQKAGFQAVYAMGESCSLPKTFVEKMLLTQLAEEQKEVQLKYPWVIFFNGEKWISLFPWMKEMQVSEGYDLYSLMPEEYASADRWILHYLKNDERILKHIGSDKDDTAGVLFVRFVEEELSRKGLSLGDVGVHRSLVKKQFASWEDFPRPFIKGDPQIFENLQDINPFAQIYITISSHENPGKNHTIISNVAPLNESAFSIRFSRDGEINHRLHYGGYDNPIPLDPTDHTIDIKVAYVVPVGPATFRMSRTLSIAKGTTAALCFHCGGAGSQVTSLLYKQFDQEEDEYKRLHALLAYVGGAYFEKCGRAEQTLADLHKVIPSTALAFGLAKLAPDISNAGIQEPSNRKRPQVDMFWLRSDGPLTSAPSISHQEIRNAIRQCTFLTTVDSSSNEHQILHDVYNDSDAVSTVKLLQLAHQQHQKKELPNTGFLVFANQSFETAESTPEAAQSIYFSHLKELDLRKIQITASEQWNAIKDLLGSKNTFSDWSYAYMTPGLIANQEGTYKEMGSLILNPHSHCALISNNNLILHGGLGSPLPGSHFSGPGIRQSQLVPSYSGFGYRFQASPSSTPNTPSFPGTKKSISDVRPDHKTSWSWVGDPVDVVTGAFYVDEVDLSLPGPFPLEIRRNYNSQNPLIGHFGCGWKLSLNPSLIEQDGKLYAAEEDGTVMIYRFNGGTSRWEVSPEDNPDLCNFNKKGIGSTANPFHAYIENNVLHGADGSKRFFETGLLKKWVNARGNTLTFSYDKGRLSQIESSNGDYCGLHYNHEGKISEIYAKDGRRMTYSYDSQGDLRRVKLPNDAIISYEYDKSHRIIKETKPHGRVLENRYKDGRVKEQLSPMGPRQEMIISATFDYQDGLTTVKDANGGCTTYKIFQKQIYKITDPLGHQTLQAWFIDNKSWFDPETERIVEWNQPGGWQRSLKSSTDKRGLITYYLYDSRGNPEEIGLKGEDLTGSGEKQIAKKLAYNAQNLCCKEETAGRKTLITYDATFPYLPKRIEKYSENTLFSYTELDYNALGQVEKENHSGAMTLWKYDARGFPHLKTQVTGTDDPDLITTYFYNHQGQCIKTIAPDSIQESDYDIMGNMRQSQGFSPTGALLSATYVGYNLNNEPIWKQTANEQNVLHLDYHASGRIKATRQNISPTNHLAYTLYEYDRCGYLIEEVDPLGHCTYRDYDLLGRVKRETKENLSTLFTYEAGGLIETVISPSGAKTTRRYTTNGLLKEETYPDGTKSSIIYDFFGRPNQETKNGITWEVRYDDAKHRVIRTHSESKVTEIQKFDERGNLVRFTDAAGYTWVKTYDGLGRLKTETSPSGEQTRWSYQKDTVICTRPNGEKTVNRYEGGQVVEAEVFDAAGELIARSSFHYDPETDIQEVTQGEETTTTWMNALGLPVRVQKGELSTTYEYDAVGQCIASKDGEGRTTRQKFDGLGRIIQKELPDGSVLGYDYDLDSNLCECRLPNNVVWIASYDEMGRKYAEELRAGRESSQRWEYTYESGYLKETKDPMQRVHAYFYDSQGRLFQENVEGWQRTYTYDPRGSLATAEQKREDSSEHTLVTRTYDPDGHLNLETIHLNSSLLQGTHQTWSPSGRSLEIEGHERRFVYQNNQLIRVSAPNIELAYSYDLSGSLKSKTTPVSMASMAYNGAGLPERIYTQLPGGSHEQSLKWDLSGKLSFYSGPEQQKQFAYTPRGHLKSAGEENYEFDFGTGGTGIRTLAPHGYVPQDGLDEFGKIRAEVNGKELMATTYNLIGEVIFQNQRQFDWDPWGRLLKVMDGAFAWEASYDALGRRLQTHYASGSSTITTTSLYDPEEEFQEIGVKYGNKIFWKIYGPNSCDAVCDEEGASVYLIQNALGHLMGAVAGGEIVYSEQLPSAYGPQTVGSVPSDLFSYAQSLTWQSRGQDPTGLIWMGARYYDPMGGRFISPDPVSYPLCLDLYAYAGGDPVNYFDPDGRCFSSIYQTVKPAVINAWSRPSVQGTLQAFGGLVEAGIGGGMTLGSGGIAAPLGWPVMVHGMDHFITGLRTAFSGKLGNSATSQLLQKTGMSSQKAGLFDSGLSIVGTMGGVAAIRASQVASFPTFNLPAISPISTMDPQTIRFSQNSISNSFRDGTRIDDLALALSKGTIKPNAIQPVRLVNRNNLFFSLDNRRLEAFRRAGVQVPYRMATSEEIAAEAWKFTSSNEGTTIRIRGK